MRIGYDTLIENPLAPSSAIDYLQHLLRSMAEYGPEHEFFVFVSPKNRYLFETKAPNVHFINCFVSNENIPLRILVQQLYYPLLAWRQRLDVVFALNQIPLLSSSKTVAKICTLHHRVAPEEFKTTPRLSNRLRLYYRQWMIDASARTASLVVANSSTTRDGIVDTMGISPSKVRVVYEAVDDRFGQVDADTARKKVRQDFGFTRDYILYCSSLWYYKNPEGAVRAFARMWQKHGTDLNLVVTGADEYKRVPYLRSLAEEGGVGSRVLFTGKVPIERLVALYAGARVFFYPSLAETFGKPIVEAMRSGVPIVTSDASCMPEIVGSAGLLVDPKDTESLAAALYRAATDPILRNELVQEGSRRSGLFTWQNAALQTLEACREACEGAIGGPVSAAVVGDR